MNEEVPFVYLMRRRDRGWKVGFSFDPESRRDGLGKSFFRVAQTWQTPLAWKVEQLAHKMLDHLRDRSAPGKETFRGTKEEMVAGIKEALRISELPSQAPAVAPKLPPKTRRDRRPALEIEDTRLARLVEKYASKMEAINDAQR